MKLSDFLNWLDSYLNFEKQQKKGIFWLESMRFLCGKLGNPQNDVPCIHIAGSKGKGSVNSAHLDRFDPHKGYVKGNVAWISGRANRIKYDASLEELKQIVNWMERVTTIPKGSTPKQVEAVD